MIDDVRSALIAWRDGDTAAALTFALVALDRKPTDGAISGLVGTLYCESGNFAQGIGHLRTALVQLPDDIGTRANLARALLSVGSTDEALLVCTEALAASDGSMRLWRLRALALQQAGRNEEAADGYLRVVARIHDDFESWNNLGNIRGVLGDEEGAVAALRRAAALRPDLVEVELNLASRLGAARQADEAIAVLQRSVRAHPADPRPLQALGHWLSLADRDAEAAEALTSAVELAPNEVDLWVAIGIARMKLVEPAPAEVALRRAIALQGDHVQAHIHLGILLESNNRLDDLALLLEQARLRGVDRTARDFVEALLLRRRHLYAETLALIEALPPEIEPVRIAQMRGDISDRLGDAHTAFAAFVEMNRLAAEDPSDPRGRAARYRDDVRFATRRTSPQWVASWQPATPDTTRPAPIFLVGFPRSGTTLLDTLLLGHPAVRVLEERPPLRLTEGAMGHFDRLATLNKAEMDTLRARYFAEVDAILPYEPGTVLVDKFPLHMNKAAIIHRLFPDARFILAERHPCDVVLSCFITNFSLNYAMANFLDLQDTAKLYDLSFTCWDSARAAMSLNVHPVRYERLLADREAELRGALEFIGLPWDSAMLDHESTAWARGNVRTASYSQVTEPLYDRAKGRWTRYRHFLEPVLPILEPWVTRMGYSL